MNKYKIQVWGIGDDGDGFVVKLGTYNNLEDIRIHTNMFRDMEINFEYIMDEDEVEDICIYEDEDNCECDYEN